MQRKLIGGFFILMVLLIIGSTSEKVQASPTSSNGLLKIMILKMLISQITVKMLVQQMYGWLIKLV